MHSSGIVSSPLGRSRPRLGPLRDVARAPRLRLRGAGEHNFKSVDVALPIGAWTCVTEAGAGTHMR
jgi:excinuclease UvrABC ATPase subunit